MPGTLPASAEATRYNVKTKILLDAFNTGGARTTIIERVIRSIIDDIKEGKIPGIDRESLKHFTDTQGWGPVRELDEIITRVRTLYPTATASTNSAGDWIVTVDAPATPVAAPEMDLSVPRDLWPEIIAKTSGHMLAYGPPGTGKSHTFAKVAGEITEAEGKTYYEVSCTRQTSAAAWIGHWVESLVDKKDGGQERAFVWSDGPAALAMMDGVPLVVNDIHLCSDDLYDLMYLLMDGRPGLKLSLPGGRELTPTPGYRVLASMNGLPEQVLDEPIRDRLQIKFEIKTPSSEQLKTLDGDVRALCRVMYENAGPSGPKFTFREFWHFCKNRRELGDQFLAAAITFDHKERARAFIEPILVGQKAKAERAAAKG